MLRTFGSFLLVFWMLSLVVHASAIGHLFGWGAFALLAIDGLLSQLSRNSRPSRTPGLPLL